MMKKKKTIITMMLVVVSIMAIGYSYFATRLNINATGSIEGSWRVYFSKIEVGEKSSGAKVIGSPSVTDTTANMNASLKVPGDYINFNITLVNGGSVNAIIEEINAIDNGTNAIIFSIDGIKIGDKLAGGTNASKVITVRMEYSPNVTNQPVELTKRLIIDLDVVQDMGQSITAKEPFIATKLSSKILNSDIAYDANAFSPNVVNAIGIDFSEPSSIKNGKGLYYMDDDTGTSYFFRGDVSNNYVKFGTATYEMEEIIYEYRINVMIGFDEEGYEERYIGEDWYQSLEECEASLEYAEYKKYGTDACEPLEAGTVKVTKTIDLMWRVVRINGDGSIRLIIDVNEDTFKLLENYYGFSAYNYAETIDNEKVSSDVKESVDTWYKEHLEQKYGKYLVDTPYCADYDISGRLKCNGNANKYTVDSTKGNGLLDYPIGLITANEVILAGGIYDGFESVDGNYPSYLKYNVGDRHLYGTMTKGYFDGDNGEIAYFGTMGGGLMDDVLSSGYSSSETLMRPVINLRSDILAIGSGTITEPYIIQYN